MAQIPQLERFQSPAQNAPNDRINMKVQDQGSAILNQTSAITKLGEKGVQMYEMYENDKIEQISNVAEQDYTKWNNDQLAKLKAYQGDPTVAYAEYEKAAEEKRKEMIDSRAKFGDKVLSHVEGRIAKTAEKINIAASMQRGQQQEVYDNNIYESTLKGRRDGLAVNSGYISKNDPTSFAMYDQNVADIKTTIAKRGIKQGTVTLLPEDAESASHVFQDDDGKIVKVNMSPIAKERMAKELSEGVKSSLDVLIASGKIEEARLLQKRYGGLLNPKETARIENKFTTAGRKDEAYNVVSSLRGLDEAAQLDKVEKIQDPELRSEVLKIKDADERRLASLRSRKEKANYNTLGSHVLEKMNSDQPYFGIADLENDPVFKNTYDNLSVKQKKAIKEMVEAPKESNEKSLIKVQDLFMENEDGVPDISTMSPQEFAEATVGLSKTDKTKYTNMYMSMRTQTEGERRSMYKSAGSILKDQLLLDGHIRLNDYGKLEEKDQKLMIEARSKLINFMSTQPSLKDDKKIMEFVKLNSVALIKEKAFNPVMPASAVRKNSSRDTASDVKVNKQQLLDLQRKYRQENGSFPSLTDPKFEAYVKRNLR